MDCPALSRTPLPSSSSPGHCGLLTELVKLVDIAFLNEEEAQGIASTHPLCAGAGAASPARALDVLMTALPTTLHVIKCGPKGAIAGLQTSQCDPSPDPNAAPTSASTPPEAGTKWQQDAVTLSPELVVDTCGAGDAFAAGFLHIFVEAHMRGRPLRDMVPEALALGVKTGAWCVQQHGACVSPVTHGDVPFTRCKSPSTNKGPSDQSVHAWA